MTAVRIEIVGPSGAAERAVFAAAAATGLDVVETQVSRVVFLDREPDGDGLARLLDGVLVDPVTERSIVRAADLAAVTEPGVSIIEVGRLAGVTDTEAREVEAAAGHLALGAVRAATATRYTLRTDGATPTADQLNTLAAAALANPTVDRWSLGDLDAPFATPPPDSDAVEIVPIRDLDGDALAALSKERVLSLDPAELATVQAFFVDQGRDPTDAELETLAQTWSEHCAHKTFRATIDFSHLEADGTLRTNESIDGLMKSHLRAATDALAAPWVRSAFVDNAGIVSYDDTYDLAIKVETHNHPSALEPFGGANTGVGGVVRDILGVSARPIAALDVLCFAPPDTDPAHVPTGVLHPSRVADGVVAGVGDYGNKLGLPTVAGAVVYHPGYLGNPLVYCGSVGILPTGSNPTDPKPGDLVVSLGGRTGRDGIHGATFSSADLEATTGATNASAVQIGDPITEKQVIECLTEARDLQLYSAITDCGAGGFSSAVGELAETVGVEIDLTAAPRKYAGLAPWEVWLSESQERMVVSVPPQNWDALNELAKTWEVEASVIGTLVDSKQLVVKHGDVSVVDLPMEFLHNGRPERTMVAEWREPTNGGTEPAAPDHGETLLAILASPTVASKESIIRTYDHEVRGGTLVRPQCGPEADGPTDAAVCVPLGTWDTNTKAFAIGLGVNPRYGVRDPYRMALSAVDEAIRNLVCVGADPSKVAILDNFCWGNPTLPDRLGGLVRASQGCHDAALTYGTPFVSGKDSLFNEFEGEPIPGTLLITALGTVPNRANVVTSATSEVGQVLFVVGETHGELGGSMWAEHVGWSGGEVPRPVDEPLARYTALHAAIAAGLVRAAHDCSEGGIAVALAEMAIAGRIGLDVDLPQSELSDHAALFGETNGRIIVAVQPDDAQRFLAAMGDAPVHLLGITVLEPGLHLEIDGEPAISLAVEALLDAWQPNAVTGAQP